MNEQIDIWLVGNTGLRNPNRIQDGFKVFAGSPYVGNLHGKENEIGFMNYLNEKGIIQNEDGKDESGSHARKWRLMFAKNGFIYPQVKKKDEIQEDLGLLDDITPFGRSFLKADTYVTAVSAKWLQQKYATYKDDIFSGNPRTYLGSGKKKNKINLGIMETIDQQPGNFWAYNNGITALVNDYVAPHEGKDDLTISGITIINGAQTTGAISSVETLKDAWIPIRFIVCNDANIIDDIINNNNKQNEILPSDLRSNDKTQNRLRAEFAPYTKLYYSGGRRGNVRPSRSKEILDPYVVAQALLAFHGDCVTAYNSKNDLWSNDHLYSSIFPENLTAEHIIFTYALARSIDSYKLELQQKADNRTDSEEKQHKYLSKRGSKMLFLYTVSRCMEGVIGKKIRDNWAIVFKDNSDFEALVQLWKTVIKSILPMACSPLESVLRDGLKSKESSENAADTVVGLFTSVQDMLRPQLKPFTNAVEA